MSNVKSTCIFTSFYFLVNNVTFKQLKLSKYSTENGEGFKLSYKVSAYLLLRAQYFYIYIVLQKLVFCLHYKKRSQLLDKTFFYFKFSERSNEFTQFYSDDVN